MVVICAPSLELEGVDLSHVDILAHLPSQPLDVGGSPMRARKWDGAARVDSCSTK